MDLPKELYLLLSQLAYLDFSIDEPQTLEHLNSIILGQLQPDDTDNPIYTNLLGTYDQDWALREAQSNTTSGFAGIALTGPNNALVFSFRGTEFGDGEDLMTKFNDAIADMEIVLPGETSGTPNQFIDAYNFVKSTIEGIVGHSMTDAELKTYVQQNNVSFTGHSLGGGIAQYMTVLTDGESTTFNSVGIGQVFDPSLNIDPADYVNKITDYVNADDIIGNYGTQLGTTVYLAGDLDNANVDINAIARIMSTLSAFTAGQIGAIEATGTIKGIMEAVNNETRAYLSAQMGFGAHALSLMLEPDGSGGYQLESTTQSSNDIQPIIDSLSSFISNTGNLLSDAGIIDLILGIDNLEDGATTVQTATATFVDNTSASVAANIQDTKDAVAQIVDTKIAELRQLIPTLGNDVNAIKNEIIASFSEIATELALLYQNQGTLLAQGIYEGINGVDGIVDGLNLADTINDITQRILSGQSLPEAVFNEQMERLESIKNGLSDVTSGGITSAQAIVGTITGSVAIIYQETEQHLGRIATELNDLVGDIVDIGMTFSSGVGDTLMSIGQNLGDFGVDAITEMGRFSASFIDGLMDIGTGVGQLMNSAFLMFTNPFARLFQGGTLADIAALFDSAQTAFVRRVDPLILDLDGDGIETTDVQLSNTYFDLDSNGLAEKTGWVEADDGILTLDRNSDGIVNDGGELFGDRTLLNNGSFATSGFQALAEFDSNADSVIDASDSAYGQLRVWQDANGDGISTSSELKTLNQLGVTSISLNSTLTNTSDGKGNIQVRLGSYNTVSGPQAVGEYLFQRDPANSIDRTLTSIPAEIEALPNIEGAGNVQSLHTAMAEDTSGVLQDLVEQFVAATDVTVRNALVQQIIYKWVGADLIDPASRGTNFDAQKLAVLEAFFGAGFVGVGGETNPNSQAAIILQQAFSEFSEQMYVNLTAHSQYKDLVSQIKFIWDDERQIIVADLTSVMTVLDNQLLQNESVGIVNLSEFSRILKAYSIEEIADFDTFRQHYLARSLTYAEVIDSAGVRVLKGTSANDALSADTRYDALVGGDGNDTLYANNAGTVMYGQVGSDVLNGASGNDVMNGGQGNDSMYGGAGDDTYIFGLDQGSDIIHDTAGIDTILFAAGVLPENVQVARSTSSQGIAGYGRDLILTISGTTDKITLLNFFNTGSSWTPVDTYKIEQFIFANGTSWIPADVIERARTVFGTTAGESLTGYDDQDNVIYGLDGNDSIYGTNSSTSTHNDTLYGNAGSDVLYGYAGDDILIGGTNSDTLYGGTGNDTYTFNLEDGQDTIFDESGADKLVFGSGIAPADVHATRSTSSQGTAGYGRDLILTINGTTSVTLLNFFNTGSGWTPVDTYKIEQIIFADGTVWTPETILSQVKTFAGTNIGESITGYDDQDNTIYGLDGNDSIYGTNSSASVRNDTLDGGTGSDVLYGYAGDDTLLGGNGSDTLYGDVGNDTYIFNLGDGQDIVFDANGADKLVFGVNITPTDIQAVRSTSSQGTSGYGRDLILTINGSSDKVTLLNFFNTGSGWTPVDTYKLEQIVFADGTVWTPTDILEKVRSVYGTTAGESLTGYDDQDNILYGLGGNDSIYATNSSSSTHNDILDGGIGSDTLYGYAGNDALTGGQDSDTLYGGTGDDSYLFNLGDGQDIISDDSGTDKLIFGAGILPSDIKATRSTSAQGTSGYGRDLILTINGTDKITLLNFFNTGSSWTANNTYKVEQFIFADGTVWTPIDMLEKARTVIGTSASESMTGYDDQDNIMHGLDGNDTIYATNSSTSARNDILSGGAGSDVLYGYAGNDTLEGGVGNDTLYGGTSDDIYLFNLGDGQDTISDDGGADKLVFGVNITPADIKVSRSASSQGAGGYGRDLILTINGTADKITISNFFTTGGNWTPVSTYKLEQIMFNDGTTWTPTDILEKARTVIGTGVGDSITGYDDQDNIIYGLDGNDMMYATNSTTTARNDVLSGDAGNDVLYGYAGNDTLTGGTGNDNLYGGTGNDTYIFSIGDGQDTIFDDLGADKVVFGTGINPVDVKASRSISSQSSGGYGRDLILTIGTTGDKITVSNFFTSGGSWTPVDTYKIEQFVFADGTIWAPTDILEKVRTTTGTTSIDTLYGYDDQDNIMYGLDGSDNLYGTNSSASVRNDVIYGGAGNDTINGYAGADTLVGGSDNDNLYGGAGNDQLIGEAGADYLDGGDGDDVYTFNLGDGQDTINDTGTVVNSDKLMLGAGILPANITVSRSPATGSYAYGRHLILTINGTTDKITINNFFNTGSSWTPVDTYKIEQLIFADGTIWTPTDLIEKARTVTGTMAADSALYGYDDQNNIIYGLDGNDTIYATTGSNTIKNDALYGGAGSDTLYGYAGNDTLSGDTGNDSLQGGIGDDTYVFNLGDGQDTVNEEAGADKLVFGTNILPSDIQVTRSPATGSYAYGRHLILTIAGTSDKVTLSNFFNGGSGWTVVDTYKVEQIVFANGTIWTPSDILEKARTVMGTATADSSLYGYDDQNNIIYGLDGNDTIYATTGSNTVKDDVLYGGNGDDILYGYAGNDTLVGGTGNDSLLGNAGDDTYVFNSGDGQDSISEEAGTDKVTFGAGILPANIQVTRSAPTGSNAYGRHLILTIPGTNDKIIINNFFNGGANWTPVDTYKIEQFVFADGTIWSPSDILEKARTVTGTSIGETLYGYDDQNNIISGLDGNDTIYATTSSSTVKNDVLDGGLGSDNLYGYAGNDTLKGGVGNDYLYGDSGDDTYIFNLGDGQDYISDTSGADKIIFGAGISTTDIQVVRSSATGTNSYGHDLILTIAGTTDKLTLSYFFNNSGSWTPSDSNKIEQFVFADGTIWTPTDILEKARSVYGTNVGETLYGYDDQNNILFGLDGNDTIYATTSSSSIRNDALYGGTGNDTLYGYAGADTLDGGQGTDYLYGDIGNDTYLFNAGYGADTIQDSDSTSGNNDQVLFGNDESDLIFSRNGNNLVVSRYNSTDSLTVNYWYTNSSYQIETLTSSDGAVLANTQVDQLIQAMASYSTSHGGITWSQALAANPQEVQSVISQYWTVPTGG